MSADVAVVIPCYNSAAYIRETLRSVSAQTEDSLDIVVVDDGSTDESAIIVADMAREDSRIRLIRQANTGPSGARNFGFAAIDPSSPFVHFLDADDILQRDALRAMKEELIAHPKACAVAGTYFRIDARGARPSGANGATRSFDTYTVTDSGVVHRTSVDRLDYWDVLATNPILVGACLIRRDAAAPDPFSTALSGCEDWALWLRLARSTTIQAIPDQVLAYRVQPLQPVDEVRRHVGAQAPGHRR